MEQSQNKSKRQYAPYCTNGAGKISEKLPLFCSMVHQSRANVSSGAADSLKNSAFSLLLHMLHLSM